MQVIEAQRSWLWRLTITYTSSASGGSRTRDLSRSGQKSGPLTLHDRRMRENENNRVLSAAELTLPAQGKLGRLATIDEAGMPHVESRLVQRPESGAIDIDGWDFARARK
jgi:hypothetical protein